MRISVIIATTLVGLIASLPANAQGNVQALADRWAEAYNKHDCAALRGVYADDALLMMHGAPTIKGRAKIGDFWAEDFEDHNPLTLLKVTHAVQGSDMTLVHGDYRVVNRDDGSVLGMGRFAHIWTSTGNGDWRLDRDLWAERFDPYAADVETNVTVQTFADRWTRAYNKHDAAALGAMYAEHARLMMHGAPTIGGRADITKFWAEDFTESNPLTLLTVTHSVNGVDMILVHGNYEVVDRDDGARVGFGRFAHIWTRADNGEWRLDRDLWQKHSEPVE